MQVNAAFQWKSEICNSHLCATLPAFRWFNLEDFLYSTLNADPMRLLVN